MFQLLTDNCFPIWNYALTKYYIKWLDPILDKQKKTLKIAL